MLLGSALVTSVVFGFAARAVEPGGEAAIRTIVAAQTAAWNAGDAKSYSANVADDVGFTNILGEVRYGREAFESRHAGIFSTIFKGSHLEQSIRRIRFVTPDVAVVDVDTEMRGFAGLPPGVKASSDGVLRTRLQQVFIHRGGTWWIEAYHNVDAKVLPGSQ